MSLSHDSALAWAEHQSASASPRLGMLEAYALQRHPDALALAGRDGASLAALVAPRTPGAAARDVGGWAVGLALVAVVLAPLIGMASLLGDPVGIWRMPIAESAPIAGVCFAIGALVQLAILGFWIARGRRRSPLWSWVSIATAVLGAIALWFGGGLAQTAGYAPWSGWSVPIIAAIIIAVLAAALQLLLSRPASPAPVVDESAAHPPEDAGALRAAIDAIAPAERQAVLADRDAALAALEQRGLLAADAAERARAAQLGTLHELDLR
ncbi:hypothetical protein [Agrococcus sp. ARC_14]|uniref:hypothetical protein n=1 Tax=Agrococcus sp. ARC_14 TaxID=2919927 RepID=UPI001F06509D|nr:hypothetical protein [Agrococcus sp. ARC_14]MCH1884139.1 hypothetical protein [Agrococcus sp. ARC_14]